MLAGLCFPSACDVALHAQPAGWDLSSFLPRAWGCVSVFTSKHSMHGWIVADYLGERGAALHSWRLNVEMLLRDPLSRQLSWLVV